MAKNLRQSDQRVLAVRIVGTQEDAVHNTLSHGSPVGHGVGNLECAFRLGKIAAEATNSHIFDEIFTQHTTNVVAIAFRVWNLRQITVFVVVAPPVILGEDHRATFVLELQHQVSQVGFHTDMLILVLDERANPVWDVSILAFRRLDLPIEL